MTIVKGIILFLTILRAPLFLAISALALISFYTAEIDLSVVIIEMSRLADTPVLVSLPLFIFAGSLLSESGAPGRMLTFSRIFLGWMPGGMAVISLIVCAVFTAFTGASGVSIFALGGLLLPALLKDGYTDRFSTGLITSSGSLGLLFPPSLPIILYGVVAEVRIDHLFLAGILPGLLMLVLLITYSIIKSPKGQQRVIYSTREKLAGLREIIWELPLPAIILGGIYGGIFTPTEAAGVAVVYGLFVGIFIYKEIKLSQLWKVFVDASVSSAIIMYIMGCAGAFTWILTTSGVATELTDALLSLTQSDTVMLLVITLIFLIAGCFVDSASGFYLLLPILLPIIKEMHYPVIAFGVVATANFAIGQVTPPVGSNLFVACNIADISMKALVAKVWPFLIAGLLCLLLITFFPQIILFLPSLMGMRM